MFSYGQISGRPRPTSTSGRPSKRQTEGFRRAGSSMMRLRQHSSSRRGNRRATCVCGRRPRPGALRRGTRGSRPSPVDLCCRLPGPPGTIRSLPSVTSVLSTEVRINKSTFLRSNTKEESINSHAECPKIVDTRRRATAASGVVADPAHPVKLHATRRCILCRVPGRDRF